MIQAMALLLASRKSIVGFGAIVLVGLVYFFGDGDPAAKSATIISIGGVAATIINAIGKEDAAEKAAKVGA